jgi:ABC-type uncharacterized transport system substrate-binding protein
VKRREFITLLGGTAVAWPLAAGGQQPAMPVVGLLGSASALEWTNFVAALRGGLGELGYVEGRSVAIEQRWADGHSERLPALAAELVALRVAVLVVAGGTEAAAAAKAATSAIPIVFAVGSDPVGAGLVQSLNRPDGNITGVSFFTTTLESKRMELLHELAPHAAVIAALVDADSPLVATHTRDAEAAGRAIGRQVLVITAARNEGLGRTFRRIAQSSARALLVASSPFFTAHREALVALAERDAIPASYSIREFAAAGGLMSYGSSVTDAHRRAGIYVGRILKGERAGDLPVQQPTKFELVINLKTAKVLGLEVPPMLLARADEVIE